MILTDDEFKPTPRTGLTTERRQEITANLLKRSMPFAFVQPATGRAGYTFCGHCKSPILSGGLCLPCERMRADREAYEDRRAFIGKELKALGLIVLIALLSALIFLCAK